jgi:hypothetical protein
MKVDNEYPRLTPPDDRYPHQGGLLRAPQDLDASQFDLLAAAWAEEALAGDSLAEIESIFESDPSKRIYAESFRKLRLVPGNEKWKGRDRLLRSTSLFTPMRLSLFIAGAAAAVIMVIVTLRPVTRQQAGENITTILPEVSVIDKTARPLITRTQTESTAIISGDTGPVDAGQPDFAAAEEKTEITRPEPVMIGSASEIPALTARLNPEELEQLNFKNIEPSSVIPEEQNWIVSGLARLSQKKPNEEKRVDGYSVADACIKGINTVLGWEMDLEKGSSGDGETGGINFTSRLLTVSAPAKKTSQ